MHRILIGVVVSGAVIIAGIGFAGSYAAVRELAIKKGFGNFSYVFPIGIDAGICVLLALDLLLTWIRIPFPLLRQTAWLLTAATIAFNGAAAWPDPLGVGMHAVIPVLFVVSVEAARHAIGRCGAGRAHQHGPLGPDRRTGRLRGRSIRGVGRRMGGFVMMLGIVSILGFFGVTVMVMVELPRFGFHQEVDEGMGMRMGRAAAIGHRGADQRNAEQNQDRRML